MTCIICGGGTNNNEKTSKASEASLNKIKLAANAWNDVGHQKDI